MIVGAEPLWLMPPRVLEFTPAPFGFDGTETRRTCPICGCISDVADWYRSRDGREGWKVRFPCGAEFKRPVIYRTPGPADHLWWRPNAPCRRAPVSAVLRWLRGSLNWAAQTSGPEWEWARGALQMGGTRKLGGTPSERKAALDALIVVADQLAELGA